MPSAFKPRSPRLPSGTPRDQGERLSEYFDPDRAQRFVRRHELLAILTQFHKASRQNTLRSKLWRWLRAPRGSGGVHAVEPPNPPEARDGHA